MNIRVGNHGLKNGLMNKITRGYTSQKLHIYEGGRNSVSGIRATLFGATGHIGSYVGAKLGYISSDLVFPTTSLFHYSDEMKELKLCANLGQSWIVRNMNFNDFKMVQRVMSNSNVVVNMCGPRRKIKHKKDFEEVNINVARKVARAARLNPEVLRLIHFSAVGASPDSPSLDLQTKYWGEQAVLEEFPNATIIRPTTIYGPNDYLIKKFLSTTETWYDFIPVFNDCTQLRQPIHVNDIAQCVLNALKLEESCGKIYEVGGPAVYTQLELYEIMMNQMNRQIALKYFDSKLSKKIAELVPNWRFFSLDELIKDDLDLVVDPKAKKISDLYINPISFPVASEQLLAPYAVRVPRTHEYDES